MYSPRVDDSGIQYEACSVGVYWITELEGGGERGLQGDRMYGAVWSECVRDRVLLH